MRINIFTSQKIRFLLVGALNTALGYGLFALALLLLGESLYIPAYVIAYALSILAGFTLQRTIVFRVRGDLWKDLLRYASVQLTSFLVNLVLLPLLVEVFGLSALIAQGIILVLTLVGTYFAHRHFSFRRSESIGGSRNDRRITEKETND